MGFDTYYPDNPWTGVDRNQRSVYWPELLETFRMRSVWRPFVRNIVNLAAQSTGTIYFDEVFDTEPDVTAIGNRAIWLPSRHLDSRRVSIGMEHHGDKISLHKYDRLVTYWRKNGGDLSQLCRGALGQNMVDYLDTLARNAMIAAPFKIHSGGVSNFNALTTAAAHKYDPSDGQKIFKSMANLNVPLANNPNGGVPTLLAITSPTVIFDIQDHDLSSKWVTMMQYSRPEMALRYEVGQWVSVRYLQTVRNTLLNAGAVANQTTISACSAGDGGYTGTVDGVYTVGQSGATGYVTVASAAGLAVGDIVTIHKTRTRAYGALDGVNPVEGTQRHRRIVNINGTQIAFEKPLLDDFTGTTYLTEGTDIHMSSFIGGPCLAAGVGQPPQVYAPPAIDDMMAIQRFTWDAYLRYQLYRPEFGAVIFSGGSSFLEYSFA